MSKLVAVATFSMALLAAGQAVADPVAIVSYDITNALVSGSGGWAHSYSGTITPTTVAGSFFSFANYAGGEGTLNDGVIGTTVFDTQLFLVDAESVITLHFARPSRVDTISLFGGNIPDNSAPGSLRGTVTVTANGTGHAIPALPFGSDKNDFLNLAGTPLQGTVVDNISLSGFRSESLTRPIGYYSLAEITINDAPAPVPEPSTFMMFGSVLTGAALVARRRANRSTEFPKRG